MACSVKCLGLTLPFKRAVATVKRKLKMASPCGNSPISQGLAKTPFNAPCGRCTVTFSMLSGSMPRLLTMSRAQSMGAWVPRQLG